MSDAQYIWGKHELREVLNGMSLHFRALSKKVELGVFTDNQLLKQPVGFIFHGILASALLTTAYFVIVSILESFNHAVTQFVTLVYLFVPLILSFGVQITLFSYARYQSKIARQRSMNVTTSSGMSTASMILCCAHHLSDVAALVGLTAVTLFLTTYQPVFLLIGILSNVFGILTVLLFLQKNMLYNPEGSLVSPMKLNLKKIRKIAVVIGVIAIIASIALVAFYNQPGPNNGGILTLPSKSESQNGLTIQATPQSFKYGDPVKISLALDTHSGALNFDLTQLATLQDSNGTTYASTGWGGSSGGHHVSGTVNFPALNGQPSSMQLTLKDIYGADWNFEWNFNQ